MASAEPLIGPVSSGEPAPSPTLLPNDHVKLLVELLRLGGPELGRRWLAALMAVPPEEREEVVAAVEARIAETYGRNRESGQDAPRKLHVVEPPKQRGNVVEQTIRTYEVREERRGKSGAAGWGG